MGLVDDQQLIPVAYEIYTENKYNPNTRSDDSDHDGIPYARHPLLNEGDESHQLVDNANFAVFSGGIHSSFSNRTLVYDLTAFDIREIVAGEDFAIMRNGSGHCFLLANEDHFEKSVYWKSWMGINAKLNGKDAVLIPFTVDDPIEMVFCHSICVLINRRGEMYHFPTWENQCVGGKVSSELFGGEKIVHCAIGDSHALFLSESGLVYGNGCESGGLLATGGSDLGYQFMQVETSQITEKIVKVFATYNTSLILTENNQVWSCGDHTYNATGHKLGTNLKTNEFIQIPLDEKIIDIVTGLFFVAMKTMDNKYLVFGLNNFAQFGYSNTLTARIDGPHILDTFDNENIFTIACGGYNSVIISQNRKYYISGATNFGNFYPHESSCYHFVDLKTFLGINGPFIDLGVELCVTLGKRFAIFYSKNSICYKKPLNFKKSFKICDIVIKTRGGKSNTAKDVEYPNCMAYSNEINE